MIKLFEAFAGYGTSCFALKQIGIEHELVGFSEIDKYAIQCFEQNHGGTNFGDITKINWNTVPDFDLLTGGFPCQAFSTAGKQKGEADKRGQLGLELTKALIEKQPKYFLFENVKGFMSKRFNETRRKFVKSWEEAGYKVHYKVLNTKNFGIPQNRERVWFIGIRKDIQQEFNFPEPFELKIKLKDVLEPSVDKKYFLRQEQVDKLFKHLKNQKDKGNGFGVESVPMNIEKESFALTSRDYKQPKVISFMVLIDSFNQSFPKEQDISTPLRTNWNNGNCQVMSALTQATGNRAGSSKEYTEHVIKVAESSGQIRRLTPREYFRLQGFLNDEINLTGLSDTQAYKLAGNGQSINVVKLILKKMINEVV